VSVGCTTPQGLWAHLDMVPSRCAKDPVHTPGTNGQKKSPRAVLGLCFTVSSQGGRYGPRWQPQSHQGREVLMASL
jgi:hypothetical protein